MMSCINILHLSYIYIYYFSLFYVPKALDFTYPLKYKPASGYYSACIQIVISRRLVGLTDEFNDLHRIIKVTRPIRSVGMAYRHVSRNIRGTRSRLIVWKTDFDICSLTGPLAQRLCKDVNILGQSGVKYRRTGMMITRTFVLISICLSTQRTFFR